MKQYFVYIMANSIKMTYIGITNNIERRVYEHKKGLAEGYSKKYNISKLVYFETGSDVTLAIKREKQLKGWVRAKKVNLIESINPEWDDLSVNWFDEFEKSDL